MTKTEKEKEIGKIIHNGVDNGDFIKPTQLFPFARCVVMITTKGKGKSGDALTYISDRLPDIEFCGIRNTAEELRHSGLQDSFISALTNSGKDLEEYRVASNGIFKVKKGQKNYDRGQLRGIFSTMNKSMNEASQNALKCDLVVYDEFINPEFTKNGLFTAFLKHCKTMIRKNPDAHILLLGNAHTSSSDLLIGLGCELDGETEEHQIYLNDEQGLLVVKLGDYVVKGMKDADEMIDKLGKYSEEYQRFQSGKAGVNNMGCVKSGEIHNIREHFQPLFTYDCADGSYTVGRVDDTADEMVRGKTYIKQIFTDEFRVPRLCYRPTDKRVYNTYVYDVSDFDTVRFLINEYSNGNLLFSHDGGRDQFIKLILPMLQVLLREEERHIAK